MPTTYDPTPAMVEVAQRCGVYVQFGTLEPIDEEQGTAYNLAVLAYPSGAEPGRYRRTHPPGPWSYPGGKFWDFQYVAGDEYPVFDTEQAAVGLGMCSEVYMPEVTRAPCAAWRRADLPPGRREQAPALGIVAQPDLGASDREPGRRRDDAEHLRPR